MAEPAPPVPLNQSPDPGPNRVKGVKIQNIREIGGRARPKRGPQLQVIGAEGADKAPNFGAEGAGIFEKQCFLRKICQFKAGNGKILPNLEQFYVLETISKYGISRFYENIFALLFSTKLIL